MNSVESVVVGLSLHVVVVDNHVTLDEGLLLSLFDDRRTVEVDLVVDNEEGVVGVEDVVVDGDTIEVLLEKVLEEEVLFLEGSLLLLNGQLVEVDFVVTFVEVVQLLELIVGSLIHANDLLNSDLSFDHTVGVRLVERQDLLLLSLEFTAKFSGLKDLLSKRLVVTEGLHALKGVAGQCTQMLLLLLTLLSHGALELLVMLVNVHLLLGEHLVSLSELAVVLLGLHLPVHFLVTVTVNSAVKMADLGGQVFVELKLLLVTLGDLLGIGGELVVMDLELFVKLLNLANEDELHTFKLLNVSVFGLFTEGFEVLGHLLELGVLFVSDSLDHLTELLSLELMSPLNVFALPVVLVFDDHDVAFEFDMETLQTALLEGDEVVDVDQMVSEGHLVL